MSRAALLLVAVLATCRPTDPRPDVLLIVLDATRADHLSPYGYARDTTPTLARLAADGVVYRRAVAPGTWTVPSHASLFTGRYPSSHGAHRAATDGFQVTPLDPAIPTLAERLRGAGWDTAAFCGNGAYLDPVFGLARGFGRYETKRAYPAHVLARNAVRWLRRDARFPVFLFLNVLDPHEPYRAPEPYDRLFPGKREGVTRVNARFRATREVPPPEVLEHCISQYDGELRFADAQVGVVLDELRRLGRYDGALIVVTADHGELFGEHGHLGHGGTPWDDVVHVPLIVKHPHGIGRGTVVEHPVSLVDVAPTVLEALGLPALEGAQGLPLASRSGPVFSEEPAGANDEGERAIYADDGQRVLLERVSGGERRITRYDLATDPAQTSPRDAAADPDVAALLADATRRRAAWAHAARGNAAPIAPGLAERLRALGYVP